MQSEKAIKKTKSTHSAAILALVTALTFIGLVFWQMPEQSFAFDTKSNSTSFRIARASTAFSTFVVKTASVTKSYTSKQVLSITMCGQEKTTVKLGNVSSKVKWTTSNAKVAKVKSTGKKSAKITAVSPGRARVKAVCGKKTLICTITVTGDLVKTKTLSLLQTNQKLTLKSIKGIKVKSWESSNKNCLLVNKNGVLTPLATGQIAVTCTDSKKNKYKCVVTINCPEITCEVKGSAKSDFLFLKTYYYKRFLLENKCGKQLLLGSDRIFFYPTPGTAYKELRAYNSILNQPVSLNILPLTVRNAASATFAAVSSQDCEVTKNSHFCLIFKVNGVSYQGDFAASTGNMLRCKRV